MENSKNTFNICNNIFAIQRIVNPQNKNIMNFENEMPMFSHDSCFDFWNRGKPCSNCISMRALNENISFSKVENVDGKLYLIIAAPINLNEKRYVVELVKDISNDTLYSSYIGKTPSELNAEISRLNELAIKDPLTDTYNRRFLDEQIPCSLHKYTNYDSSLSLIIMDLDKFKAINDSFGHICGDYVLKKVSYLLKEYVSNYNGRICRYGGDEFVILVENISKSKAYEIANDLKDIIYNHNFSYNNIHLDVSCSFGVSFVNRDNNLGLDFENILNIADMELLQAKKNRNKVL